MNKITITSLIIAVVAVAVAVFALVSQNGQQAGTAVTRSLTTTPTATTSRPTGTTSTTTTPVAAYKAGDVVFGTQQIITFTIKDASAMRATIIPVVLMTSPTQGVIVSYRLSALENGGAFVDAAKVVAAATDDAAVRVTIDSELARVSALIDSEQTSADFRILITKTIADFAAMGITVAARDTGFIPFFIVNENFANLTDRQMNQLLNILNEVSRNIVQLVG
jgi:hypothetical protein